MTVYSQLPAWAADGDRTPALGQGGLAICSSPTMITFRRIIRQWGQEQFQHLPGEAHEMAEDLPGQALPGRGVNASP